MLTELQKQKLTRMFNVFDANKSRTLVKNDFDIIVRNFASALQLTRSSPEYEDLTSKYAVRWEQWQKGADANNNRVVTLDEWLKYYDEVLSSDEDDSLLFEPEEKLLDLLDTDGDGKITSKEYQLFFRAYRISSDLADEVFKKLDSDGDGYISKEEFSQHLHDFYYSEDPETPGNWIFGRY